MSSSGRQDERGDGGGFGRSADDDLVALVYGELDGEAERQVRTRIAADPARAAQLAELERVQELYRALPEEEPPAALTAQIMMQAAQAAAERRARARAQASIWSRVKSWFAPLVAHPGLTAFASAVLVAGVAGLLLIRDGERARTAAVEEEAPATTSGSAASSEAVPPAAPASESSSAPESTEYAAADQAGADPPAPAGAPAEVVDKESGRRPVRRQRAGAKPGAGGKSALAEASPPDTAKSGEVPGAALGLTKRDSPAADGRAGPTGSAAGAESPARLAQEMDEEQAERPADRPAPASPAPPPANKSEPPPAQDRVSASRSPKGQAPAELHRRAVEAASRRQCAEVQALGRAIRRADGVYYDKTFRADRRLAVCLAARKTE